jgi:RNA-directed DNA polymerase
MRHPWSPQQFASGARERGRPPAVIEAGLEAARAVKRVDPDLPVVLTMHHLAHLSGVDPHKVRAYATRRVGHDPYRSFLLRKRSPPSKDHSARRGFREISVPEPELMRLQRWITQNILSESAPHSASYAFHREGGLLRAASRHAGCTWLVKMDIRDFFDSIAEQRVYRVFRRLGYGALLSFQMARICTRVFPRDHGTGLRPYGVPGYHQPAAGRLPQGAPTSPALANLAVLDLDRKLNRMAMTVGWTYTRYADDLAFSTTGASSRDEARRLVALIKEFLRSSGLEPTSAKTVIAPPGARRLVLGLQVDGPEPRLTRAFRNNLETHLYALTAPRLGPEAHREARGFASLIGMRRHVEGLLAFAHYVEPQYAKELYSRWNSVAWPL